MDHDDSRLSAIGRPRSLLGYYSAVALAVGFIVQVLAAFRGGYVGPDYPTHVARLVDWRQVFDWSATSPPTYYLLGHCLFIAIGSNNAFPITLSIIQAAINAVALWWFFRMFVPRITAPAVRLSLVLFLTFLPVRLIHAVTIGTDCTTVPMFVLSLFLFERFIAASEARLKRGAYLSAGLTLAIALKYSFMALLPSTLGVLLCYYWRDELRRFVCVALAVLILPSLFSGYTFWASSKVHGWNTEKHWRPRGSPADMNYRDLFTVKAADLQLFHAPEYFKKEILSAHKHSYLALSHLGIFTDTMNLFQILSVSQRFDTILIPDQKIRRAWKTQVMIASMSLAVLWTPLALFASAWTLILALRRLFDRDIRLEDSLSIFGTAFFLLMFLPIPFTYAGTLFGYWTPRLILPSLLYFFAAMFLFLDRKLVSRWPWLAIPILAAVAVQCGLVLIMLS